MEYLGYTCHRNLNADAESEKSNELINNLISHRSQPLNKPLPLRKEYIKDGRHTNNNKRNDQIINPSLQQFAFNTGRRHQSKDNRYTARPDTDRKRDGIKYLLLDVFPSETV